MTATTTAGRAAPISWTPSTTQPPAWWPRRRISTARPAATAAPASDPWKRLETTESLTAYDATDPGNVVQAARTGLNGRPGKQTMTLAIGLGRNVSGARAAVTASLERGFDAARTQYDAGWAAYFASDQRSRSTTPGVEAHDRLSRYRN